MTPTEYGQAYQVGFASTVRLLVARGVEASQAEELAQEAWARGWEKTLQGTQPLLIRTWINITAIHLSSAEKISDRWSQPLVELSRLAPLKDVNVFATSTQPRMGCTQHSRRPRRPTVSNYAPVRGSRRHRTGSLSN
jgi:hypothetical protein